MKNGTSVLRWVTSGILYLSVLFFFLPYYVIDLFFVKYGISPLKFLQPSVEMGFKSSPIVFILLLIPMLLTLIPAILITIKSNKVIYTITITCCWISVILYIFCIFFSSMVSAVIPSNKLGIGIICNLIVAFLGIILSIVCLIKVSGKNTYIASGAISCLAGMYTNQIFEINEGEELIIGRDSAFSHIVLNKNADKVSRKHCGVIYNKEHENYIIIDYSSNGTFVLGGNRLIANTQTTLPPGTIVYLGNKTVTINLDKDVQICTAV